MPNLSTIQCQGWTNPSTVFYGPVILSLSSYFSPAGSTNLVTIYGENFYSYSTVLFATYNPSVYFISSNTLQFYVPASLYPGIYPLQVYNGSTGSNIVTYTLDNSSGYWILNPNNSITNTNTGGLELAGPIQFPDGTIQNTAYNPLIGEIKLYGGLTLPPDYLWCNGSTLNITDFPELFSVISNKYGGDGITTFNLPNLQQKFPIGSSNTSNMDIVYKNPDGSTNTLVTGGNQQMTTNQLGTHTHNFNNTTTINSGNYIESIGVNNANNTTVTTAPTGQRVVNVNSVTQSFTNLSLTTTVGNNDYTNQQEDLLPPFTVVQYIICYH
jgi:microcystin-dependent protein